MLSSRKSGIIFQFRFTYSVTSDINMLLLFHKVTFFIKSQAVWDKVDPDMFNFSKKSKTFHARSYRMKLLILAPNILIFFNRNAYRDHFTSDQTREDSWLIFFFHFHSLKNSLIIYIWITYEMVYRNNVSSYILARWK